MIHSINEVFATRVCMFVLMQVNISKMPQPAIIFAESVNLRCISRRIMKGCSRTLQKVACGQKRPGDDWAPLKRDKT
jgi:hypothetical protein